MKFTSPHHQVYSLDTPDAFQFYYNPSRWILLPSSSSSLSTSLSLSTFIILTFISYHLQFSMFHISVTYNMTNKLHLISNQCSVCQRWCTPLTKFLFLFQGPGQERWNGKGKYLEANAKKFQILVFWMVQEKVKTRHFSDGWADCNALFLPRRIPQHPL